MRALVTSLLSPDISLALDALVGRSDHLDARWSSEEFGVDAAELGVERLDDLRASWFRSRHAELRASGQFEVVKLHGSNRVLQSGRRLVDYSAGRAIVVVRHPFDIVGSYAEFVRSDPDRIVDSMTNPDGQVDRTGPSRPWRLPEVTQSWAMHVESWCVSTALPSVVIRYEDLLDRPREEVRRVCGLLGFEVSVGAIDAAIAVSRFDRLRQAEREHGLAWKPRADVGFFRSGRAGNGVHELSGGQRHRLIDSAGSMMELLGYRPDGTVSPRPLGRGAADLA